MMSLPAAVSTFLTSPWDMLAIVELRCCEPLPLVSILLLLAANAAAKLKSDAPTAINTNACFMTLTPIVTG